jgi:hypothetical protein
LLTHIDGPSAEGQIAARHAGVMQRRLLIVVHVPLVAFRRQNLPQVIREVVGTLAPDVRLVFPDHDAGPRIIRHEGELIPTSVVAEEQQTVERLVQLAATAVAAVAFP